MISLIIAILLNLGIITNASQYNPNSASQHQALYDWVGDEEISDL